MSSQHRFQLIGSNGETIELTESALIGRSSHCDIVLVEAHLSRRHAQLTLENDRMYVKDMNSANGTFINRIQVHDRQPLVDGDRLAFGLTSFLFRHTPPLSIYAKQAYAKQPKPEERRRFVLRNSASNVTHELLGPTVIGTQQEMLEVITLVLDNPGVSASHALLTPKPDGILVKDLGSSNGTFINDVRVTGSDLAKINDTLRFHLLELKLEDSTNETSHD